MIRLIFFQMLIFAMLL